MKKISWSCAVAALAVWNVSAAPVHSLWYDRPADDSLRGWEQESLPLGCGQFGISVFGGVERERLQLTENSFLTRRNLTNALDIRFRFDGHNNWNAQEYRRDLTLETGVATVGYAVDGVRFTREYFTSYPARALAVRLTASKKGALSFSFSPDIPNQRQFGIGKEAWIGREGRLHAEGDTLDVTQRLQWYNVRFFGRFVVKTDGKLTTLDHTIEVSDASEATVFFCCGTNYRLSPDVFTTAEGEFSGETEKQLRDEDDPTEDVKRRVAAAVAKGWDVLKAEHLADFGGLMRRATVTLPGSDAAEDRAMPTDKLLSSYGKGRASAYLEETYFQYGRYLLVSSSRPGTLPANLQGVWTAHDKSPWGAGYWHNINVQMNYWPAFNCNLAECFQAYADFNKAFRPVTRRYAEAYLKKHVPENAPKPGEESDCWCIGTASYPYAICGGPHGHSGPGTGGLTTKCFKDWYDFTLDETALREYVWPTLHGMADFLTRCVRDYDGEWLSVFSASPEQWEKKPDGTYGYYNTVGCAFDQQMIHENNADTLALAKKLGVKDAVTERIERQLGHYAPVLVGESGQVKEFREEKKYGEIGEYAHRHISQLVGLYPGTIINKNRPEWMAAAKYSLTERSDESTGWALAHRLNCWARLGDGDHCHKLIRNLLGQRTYANLWDAHPPFQIDGNFGATAGIAEMLLQSHAGYIDLLPSLPKAWAKEGSFRGLCARGAYEVDCDWKDGKPVRVLVRAKKGGKPEVRFAGKAVPFETLDAANVFTNPIGAQQAPDPFVTYDAASDWYYCLYTEGTVVRIRRAREPQRLLADGDVKTLFVTNAACKVYRHLWAPEMYKAPNGKWYVYTSADTTPGSEWTLRLVCLESETSDPFDGFHFKSFPLPDVPAIDPSVHWTDDGRGYLACARHAPDGSHLAIYELADPWTCRGAGVELARPTLAWEKKAGMVLEGPFFVRGTDKNLFLVYSANDTRSEDYALGALALKGANLMDAASWQKRGAPVLFKANGVYGPGHASFFRTRGGELWCAYHGMETPDGGDTRTWKPRLMHLQPADPDDDGCPHLAGAWGRGPHRVPDAPKAKLPPLPDGAFTYAVIPDTQRYGGDGAWRMSFPNWPTCNAAFESRVNWIAKNARRENIAFVSHVGDVTDCNNAPQYHFASNLMARLDGIVPWRAAAGNHDMVDKTGDTTNFERTFGSPNRVDLFEAGGMKFVLVTIVCNAPEAVMRWADEQLEKHADRKAIVCTHAYLGPLDPKDRYTYARRDGKTGPYECRIPDCRLGRMPWLSSFGEYATTNGVGHSGEAMWRDHFSKHKNLFLIVCGDQSAVVSQHLVDTGANGNVVHAFMQDYPRDNDRMDPIRLFRFVPSANKVEVFTVLAGEDVLCTRAKFLEEHHRFTFELYHE